MQVIAINRGETLVDEEISYILDLQSIVTWFTMCDLFMSQYLAGDLCVCDQWPWPGSVTAP